MNTSKALYSSLSATSCCRGYSLWPTQVGYNLGDKAELRQSYRAAVATRISDPSGALLSFCTSPRETSALAVPAPQLTSVHDLSFVPQSGQAVPNQIGNGVNVRLVPLMVTVPLNLSSSSLPSAEYVMICLQVGNQVIWSISRLKSSMST